MNFGPRINGKPGYKKTVEYIVSTLKKYTHLVNKQKFQYLDIHDSSKIYNGINIVASFNTGPGISKRIMLAAHYDTRPTADQETDSSKKHLPVPEANDGASGVALLLGMSRLFSIKEPAVGVDLVFFDLEDIRESFDTLSKIL